MNHRIPSVLVIEDNRAMLQAWLALLPAGLNVGYVLGAASAEAALEILKRECFALILADYQLDGMDGVQFLESIRARGNPTPVVLISGAPDRPAVLRALRQSRVEFLAKPVPFSDLAASIKRLIHPPAPLPQSDVKSQEIAPKSAGSAMPPGHPQTRR